MKRVLILSVLFLMSTALTAWSFDGQRTGFVLGGGLGTGITSYVIDAGGLQSARQNQFSFMTDFKIGYAPTNQMEVVYSGKSSWWGESGITFMHGYHTAAVNYFIAPQTPSFYVTGGLGFSTLSAPFESNTTTDVGFGIFAGGGYEFAPHYAVEFNLAYGAPGDSGARFKGLVPRVTFVATAF